MREWKLEKHMYDGRVVVLMRWRGFRTSFRTKWTRWVVGVDAGDSYPLVRGSPMSPMDESVVLDMLHSVRRTLITQQQETTHD